MNIDPPVKKQCISKIDPPGFNSIVNFIRKKPYTAPELTPLLLNEIAGGDQTHVAEASGGFLSLS